jgi:hypothetical protein
MPGRLVKTGRDNQAIPGHAQAILLQTKEILPRNQAILSQTKAIPSWKQGILFQNQDLPCRNQAILLQTKAIPSRKQDLLAEPQASLELNLLIR